MQFAINTGLECFLAPLSFHWRTVSLWLSLVHLLGKLMIVLQRKFIDSERVLS
jgi:hypothetical protein